MLEFEKFFRDPLYGFIGLTHTELELLGTPVVQRLRRIKQLGNTHLVYPSACHSRFEHTLGVLHIANRMAEKLRLNETEIAIIRIAALLHDIGHGPLSHNFETILENINNQRISHESITLRIIEEDRDLDRIMGGHKDDVLLLFDEKNDTVNRKIISGNIDADRLDYLRRDSYHSGVAYGIFDLERILHTIQKIVDGDRSEIAILKKGQDAIESYRLARFLMHTQVYYHHVRAITDNMLNRAVEIAVRDEILGTDLLKFDSDDFLNNYLSLDDSRLFRKIEGKLAEKCNCDKDFIIINLQKIENTLYKSSYEFFKSGETPILILDDDGPREIEKESPIFGSQDPLLKLYIFCPEENKAQVDEFAEEVLL